MIGGRSASSTIGLQELVSQNRFFTELLRSETFLPTVGYNCSIEKGQRTHSS